MLQITKIVEALRSVVGWQQNYDIDNQISQSLTIADSGLFFQGANPLVTLENVRSIMPIDFIKKYRAWVSDKNYVTGDKVRYEDSVYIANKDSIDVTPSIGEDWESFNELSDYLLNLTDAAIAEVVQRFITMKSLAKQSRNLLDNAFFFDGVGNIRNTVSNNGRLCGFRIKSLKSIGVTTKINRVGLQFLGKGSIALYLFHSSQAQPIQHISLSYTNGDGSMQWFNVQDWIMPYVSDRNNAGGEWYITYNQNDLPSGMQAINADKDFNAMPCSSCSNSGGMWTKLRSFVKITPFKTEATAGFKENPMLWDIDTNVYMNATNYGLNVEVSVLCDLTDFIIQQRSIFANVIQLQVAQSALLTMTLNPNNKVNKNQVNVSRQDVIYQVEGDTQGRTYGIASRLNKYYDALILDTQGLDKACLTCNRQGITFGAI